VIKFLRMLTFLPLNEIDALEQAMTKPDYVPNTAQKRLAEAVTRYMAMWQPLHTACDGLAVHGSAEAGLAAVYCISLFMAEIGACTPACMLSTFMRFAGSARAWAGDASMAYILRAGLCMERKACNKH
jgi:hypothetical protein